MKSVERIDWHFFWQTNPFRAQDKAVARFSPFWVKECQNTSKLPTDYRPTLRLIQGIALPGLHSSCRRFKENTLNEPARP
jgi:hypothetical protein